MNLINLDEGDLVIFRNGDERKVASVYRYDCGLFGVRFCESVIGTSCKSKSWTYRIDGKYDREDITVWANDIVKIIKKDVDTQVAAE